MGVPVTEHEMVEAAQKIANKLLGWSVDITEGVEQAELGFGYDQGPVPMFKYLDTLAWRCKECDIWHPPRELDEDELCIGCRPSLFCDEVEGEE